MIKQCVMRVKLFLFSTFFLLINCSEQDNTVMTEQGKEKESIDRLRKELYEMAENSVCSDTYTCAYVGIGAKPCGGPWEYLVYSTSIDEQSLMEKVDALQRLEKAYNEKFEIGSDCMVVAPPDELICEDGKCKGVYQ